MRRILNLFIIGLILWVATKLFPGNVMIDSPKTLVIVTLAIFIVGTIIALLGFLLILLGIVTLNPATILLTVIVGVVVMMFSDAIALNFLAERIPGFMMRGTLTPYLLGLAFSIFSVNVNVDYES